MKAIAMAPGAAQLARDRYSSTGSGGQFLAANLLCRQRIARRIAGSLWSYMLLAILVLATVAQAAHAQMSAEILLNLSTGDPVNQQQMVNDAVAAFNAGDLEGARTQLMAACRDHAKLPPSRVLMAYLLVSNKALSAARNELELVVVELSADPESYAMLADLAYQDGRRAEAELLFARSLRLAEALKDNPQRKARLLGRAHAGLAAVAEARGQWPEAREHLTAWLKNEPDNEPVHRRLATAWFHLGKPKEAYQELQTTAKADPNSGPAAAELALAEMYEQAGDQANGAKMIGAAIKRGGENLTTRLAAAEWALRADRLAEAQTHAAAALAIDEHSSDALVLSGAIARLQRESAQASKFLEAAHLEDPENFQATNLLAQVLADGSDSRDQQRALKFAKANAARYPQNAEAAATMGWVYQRLGLTRDAEVALSRALTAGTLSADGAYFAATMLQRQGRREEAAKLAAVALETKQPFLYRAQAAEIVSHAKGQGAELSSADEKSQPPTRKTSVAD
jgi:tetratricopeptide (TPR) repeat protein